MSDADDGRAIERLLGDRIRFRRRVLGLTQSELGAQVDVRFQQIQKYETGQTPITASRLYKVSRVLGASAGYFFKGLAGESAGERSDFNFASESAQGARLLNAFARLSPPLRAAVLECVDALAKDRG